MSRFIIEGKSRNPASRETDFESNRRLLTIDSRGRISIPADIRRSFGLVSGSRISMMFDLEEGIIMLFSSPKMSETPSVQCCGQDGVIGGTEGCGSSSSGLSPGSGPENGRKVAKPPSISKIRRWENERNKEKG